jgi:uncharacterized protein DUF3560
MPIEDYAERQEAKRERLEDRADKAASRAQQHQKTADSILSVIPMGQPILVGHHSEKRHRRDLARADRALHGSVEESAKAKFLRARADGLGKHGISSDDPGAPDKIAERIEQLEAKRDWMKAINAAVRAKLREVQKRDPAGVVEPHVDQATALAELCKDETITLAEAKKLADDFAMFPYHGLGFPAYALTNLGANIRRLTDRLESLQRSATTQATTPPRLHVGQGYEVYEDRDENRVCVRFPSRPSTTVCQALRQAGFHWNRTIGAWTRLLNSSAWHGAMYVAERIDRGELAL